MAAYEALVSLMNTIEQIKIHPLISTYLHELETVGQNVKFLLDFIEEYSSHGGSDGLEKRIASTADEAEGVIESHIADQIRAKTKKRRSIFLNALQKIIEEMDPIKEETIKVNYEERRSKDEQRPAGSSSAATTSRRPHQTKMVIFDEEFRQLMDVLTQGESSRQTISVEGTGGIGKSTLVRNVYAQFINVRRFDVCAWASVTQEYSVKGILTDLLISFKQEPTNETVEELGEMFHKFLFSRRYLIVLDDVWNIEVWDNIQLYFPDNNNASRIVLTTRLSNVGNNRYDSSKCLIIRMNLLDEDRSWVLFCETVFGCRDSSPELEEVGKEISKQCKGLPLSIVVVGGFLRRSNKTVESWRNVAKNINSVLMSSNEDDEGDRDCYKILSLSYSQLDVHLKPCFVCMGIFEKGRKIRASRIIKVWVAGGLIKPNGAQTLEEFAEEYLHELVGRNLVIVGRQRLNGKIGSCLVHDLIIDFCKKKYDEHKLFLGKAKRIDRIIFKDFMRCYNTLELSVALSSMLIKVSSRWLPLPPVFGFFRFFDMADSSLKAIFKNLNLRFLTYQPSDTHTSLVLIPSSVPQIWNLQTLAIHGKYVVAPLEIWKLQQLRHMECDGIYIPDPPPKVRPVVLENLQTLTTVVNLRLSEEVCKRIPNVNKLYVKYDDDLPGLDNSCGDHLHNLGSLHKLRSLKLFSCFSLAWQSSFCAGWRRCTFPTLLKKLKLIKCGIEWNDLTRISCLPHLEVLKLHDSMKGHNWSPPEGGFLGLKILSIVNCDLRCWDAESSHFPVLERLFLEELRHLEEIPLDIGEISTLELIRVFRCSESADISAAEIKKEQEERGNEELEIQIQPFSEKDSLRRAITKYCEHKQKHLFRLKHLL